MKIEKDSYLIHAKCNRLGLIQIPTLNMNIIPTPGNVLEVEYVDILNAPKGVVQEYQNFPDSFFVNLTINKGFRIAFGKEDAFLYLSKIGFLCLVDEIYNKIRKEMDDEILHFESIKSTIDPVEDKDYLEKYKKEMDEFKSFTKEKYIHFMLKEFEKVDENTIKYTLKNKEKLLKSHKN